MPMWKQVASKELEGRGQHADLNGLISGYGDPAKVGYMCRKCFYSYEKLLSTQATLELKVKKTIDAISSVPRWVVSRASRSPSGFVGKGTSGHFRQVLVARWNAIIT